MPQGLREGAQSRGGSVWRHASPSSGPVEWELRAGGDGRADWGWQDPTEVALALNPPGSLTRPISSQRCEEVEAMRGQVSQEQELRAVVESCLLEQDGAREDVRAQLQETWALAQDAALILDQLR